MQQFCKVCLGDGRIEETQSAGVKIPPGVSSGSCDVSLPLHFPEPREFRGFQSRSSGSGGIHAPLPPNEDLLPQDEELPFDPTPTNSRPFPNASGHWIKFRARGSVGRYGGEPGDLYVGVQVEHRSGIPLLPLSSSLKP